jgi:acyl-[acyl carrier protein]--UDP-N-acetylglucosamine O-acyltransferase
MFAKMRVSATGANRNMLMIPTTVATNSVQTRVGNNVILITGANIARGIRVTPDVIVNNNLSAISGALRRLAKVTRRFLQLLQRATR